MFEIVESLESARGCGYRKEGGLYLVAGNDGVPCGRLPIPLKRCPCCGEGVKFTRGVTWIDPRRFGSNECRFGGDCENACPARDMNYFGRTERRICATASKRDETLKMYRNNFRYEDVRCTGDLAHEGVTVTARFPHVLLLWVGEQFYPTPQDFLNEAARMGISRRIPAVPLEFELGQTWVWLAHLRTIWNGPDSEEGEYTPGVFRIFKPTVDYVVAQDDDEDKLQKMADKGYRLVRVHREGEQTEFEQEE